ncbi:MAG: hypothetical protein ACJA2S_001335 [Cyclobacteriaceae bacterium]|jgi:hypothetical protein
MNVIDFIGNFPKRLFVWPILKCLYFGKILEKPLASAALLFTITVFFAFPSYDVVLLIKEPTMISTWEAIFAQGEDPLNFNANEYPMGSHEEKLTFRFVPAVILNLLGIDSIVVALVFQLISLLLFYILLFDFFRIQIRDRSKAFLFCLAISLTVSGHVYASDYRGTFDTLALTFLLLAVRIRSSYWVIIPLILAYYTDERALIASSGLFVLNLWLKKDLKLISGFKHQENVLLISSWVLYFIIRLILQSKGLQTGVGGVNLFLHQIDKTCYTIFIGMEGIILFFLMSIAYLYRQKKYAFSALFVGGYLLIFVVSQSVFDINRSMSYGLIIQIITILIINKYSTRDILEKTLGWVILICLAYDDFYPFIAQIFRMIFITETVRLW